MTVTPQPIPFVPPTYPAGSQPRSLHPQIDLAHMAVEVAMLRAEVEVLTIELVACVGDSGMARERIRLAEAGSARMRRALVACLDSGCLPVGAAYQARSVLVSVPVDVVAEVGDTPPVACV